MKRTLQPSEGYNEEPPDPKREVDVQQQAPGRRRDRNDGRPWFASDDDQMKAASDGNSAPAKGGNPSARKKTTWR